MKIIFPKIKKIKQKNRPNHKENYIKSSVGFFNRSSGWFGRLTKGLVKGMIRMREDTKLFLKSNGTLPSLSQSVRVNGMALAEITHFSLGHAPTGRFKTFRESPGIRQVHLWTSASSKCCCYLLPDGPSYTAPELLDRPRHQRCTVGPSPFVLCSVAGVSKLCVSCLREILCPAHLFCKGLWHLQWNPRSKELDTNWSDTSKSYQPQPIGSGWFKTSPWFLLPLGGFLFQEAP